MTPTARRMATQIVRDAMVLFMGLLAFLLVVGFALGVFGVAYGAIGLLRGQDIDEL